MLQDLRFAVRQLRQNPGFAGTAILVLALGMAASIAIFAFVNAALLRPLPYQNASRLVVAYETTNACRDCSFSYPDYLDWKKTTTVFSSLEAWNASVHLWRSPGGVQAIRSAVVSGGFFRSLGVAATVGRVFADSDDTPAAPRAVVLMYDTWQNRFGGRQDMIGQSVILDNAPYSVIGVLPREFHFAMRAAEFFTTIHDQNACEQSRGCRYLQTFGRLRDGISLEAAATEIKAIAERLERIPEVQPRARRAAGHISRCHCRRHTPHVAGFGKRGGPTVADRVRECSEPAAGQGRKPEAPIFGARSVKWAKVPARPRRPARSRNCVGRGSYVRVQRAGSRPRGTVAVRDRRAVARFAGGDGDRRAATPFGGWRLGRHHRSAQPDHWRAAVDDALLAEGDRCARRPVAG